VGSDFSWNKVAPWNGVKRGLRMVSGKSVPYEMNVLSKPMHVFETEPRKQSHID